MKNLCFRPYLIFAICLICIGSLSLTLFASSDSTIDDQLTSSISELKDIRNQVSNLAKTIYVNKLNDKDSQANQNTLNLYTQKVSQIRSTLTDLSTNNTLTKAQKATTSTLIAISSYIQYLINNLNGYANSIDPVDQFDLLANHFQVTSLITQFFSYVE